MSYIMFCHCNEVTLIMTNKVKAEKNESKTKNVGKIQVKYI